MILIVDDIPENVYSLQKVLEHHGFSVDTAFSGEEALRKILTKTYVLVILDVQMPGIDGFEVAESIKGFKKAKDTAIIFLSANSTDTNLIIKGLNQGARDYITKPVDTTILMLKVIGLYDLYKSRQDNARQQLETTELYRKEKEANQQLAKKVENMRKAIKLAKLGVWEYNDISGYLYASSQVYQLLNINPQEKVIDCDFVLQLLTAEEIEYLNESKKKEEFEFTHRYVCAQGSVKHLKHYIKVERLNNQNKFIGAVQDITNN